MVKLLTGEPLKPEEYQAAKFNLIKLMAIRKLSVNLWPSSMEAIMSDFTAQSIHDVSKDMNIDLKGEISEYWQDKLTKKINSVLKPIAGKLGRFFYADDEISNGLKHMFQKNSSTLAYAETVERVVAQALEVSQHLLFKNLAVATIFYQPLFESLLEIGSTVVAVIPGDPNSPCPAVVREKGIDIFTSSGQRFISANTPGVMVALLNNEFILPPAELDDFESDAEVDGSGV